MEDRVLHGQTLAHEVAMAERRLSRACPVWVSVPSLLGRLKREMTSKGTSGASEVEDAMDAHGLLVLDDLGAERPSEWAASTLFEMVDARYNALTSLLVTTNRTAGELAEMGYDRIVSRLADQGALIEMASAQDFRMRRRVTIA